MNMLPCDGCGRPSTPAHIAARIGRLQWATRFRPIHIQVLFVAQSPQPAAENVPAADSTGGGDAYFPPSAPQDYAALLDALAIAPNASATETASVDQSGEKHFVARLTEFQRRGFSLAFLVECPVRSEDAAALCAQYGSTLIKRIQYSYKPKHIVLLSPALNPLIAMIEAAGLEKSLLLDDWHTALRPEPNSGSSRG